MFVAALLLSAGCSVGGGVYEIALEEAVFLEEDVSPEVCLVAPARSVCLAPANFDLVTVGEDDIADTRVELRVEDVAVLAVELAAEEKSYTASADGRTLTVVLNYEGE